MNIAILDVVFIGIIIVFTLQCGSQGFVSKLMSMAALIFGLVAAIFFFRWGGDIIREQFMPEVKILPEVIAFAMLFLIVFAVFRIVEVVLKTFVEKIKLSSVDRFLGVIFGLAEGAIVVCLLLFLISIQPFFDSDSLLKGSFFAELLLPFLTGNKLEEMLDSIVLLGSLWGAHV